MIVAAVLAYLVVATICAIMDRKLVMDPSGRRSPLTSAISGILWPFFLTAYAVALVAYLTFALDRSRARRRRARASR